MKLTVYAPCYNEIFYTKAWYENVRKLNAEIIIVDTGSTDGSLEFFKRQNNVRVITNFKTTHRFAWDEAELRNSVIKQASGDVILALDLDELVGDEFVSVLTDFGRSDALIGRLIEYKFWGDMRHLRKRSLKPLIRDGKIGWLSNWRGAYPNKRPQLLENILTCNTKARFIQSYNTETMVGSAFICRGLQNYNCGIYHYHFAGTTTKLGEDRYLDRQDKVKLVEFKGQHPDEVNLFGAVL